MPTENLKNPFKRENRLAHGAWFALTWAALALFLGGSGERPSAVWPEGQVAPYTVYSPRAFTSFEALQERKIERGELLVTKGERLTAVQAQRLAALAQTGTSKRSWPAWLGALLFSSLVAGIGWIYIVRFEADRLREPLAGGLVCLSVVLVLGLARLIQESQLVAEWIPTAAGAFLISMLLSQRLAIAVGLLTVCAVGLAVEASVPWLIASALGAFVGSFAGRGIHHRIHFFRAGAVVGLAHAGVLLASHLVKGDPLAAAWPHALAGMGSGLVSALIVFCVLPLAESAFGLITDVSLLELSDLNHPLLKELSVKAPGTYHHSLLVASLAEAASEAVGANALLARVGCYFHDVGKMLHPEYFVENQPPESSRHDELTPSVSTLVIQNHVKDGIELARRHRLNPRIIDFIPGHHGTGIIYFFYRRALEEVEDESLLKEERFRYPGPKPQGREAAVALLADSVEAATRALKERTPERMAEVVRRIVNNKFIDGQLDECELTLKDLHRITETFLRVLGGIYHSRVEYPLMPGDEPETEVAS
ncbi:MAG: HDIG domain-containing protein [Candidatus Omnitrophica bacterium]|nr:HDIG domain-containing protein [Candidatus Omnitrophota bacterium]